jgi:glycine/D-amino acid oxidase-like deaminating enzyme
MTIKERIVEQKSKTQELVIIGGGIMGLMTAYYASALTEHIVILEKRMIGNQEASSFSFTRSMHTDYLDPLYARLAYEALGMWRELREKTGKSLLVDNGCLNIAKRTVTPELEETYTAKCYDVVEGLGLRPEKLSKEAFQKRYRQFDVDFGYLNSAGGYFNLRVIADTLVGLLRERGVQIIENVDTDEIVEEDNQVRISTNKGIFIAKQLVITPGGKWANEVLELVKGNELQLPIKLTQPESRYYYPEPDQREQFLPKNFPVFAYPDVGIYGHPIADEQKGAVKVAFYEPSDFEPDADGKIRGVADFVEECMPSLKSMRSEAVTDADKCFYDVVEDGDFVLGALPRYEHIFIGTGWHGAGYKFSPLIGKILSQLTLQNGTVYDIQQFNPGRFVK